MTTRIAKFIAQTGIASRRMAEDLIVSGRIAVDGVVVDTPIFFIEDGSVVTLDGIPISKDGVQKLYMFHKPINTMTTTCDPNGRKTIYDFLPQMYRGLKYVGRLDFKTTGLLLLTNDGQLARKLTLPSSQIQRTYIASVKRGQKINLDLARRGITVDGITYRPMKIHELANGDLRITVTEGKKNEIRIVLRACGAPVQKLHRISFGNIELGKLPVGKIVEISQKTVDALLKSL
ncbi:MAG: rRNA pseudouridine synthase [Alphaproteobacteria bacterium]|nr:rRNA pseudouridine synthase [Alphaproteobacteria bacterium]